MFTGIIEELGVVEAVEARSGGARLSVSCHTVLEDAQPGASVSVNGVCLTVTVLRPRAFAADVTMETLRRSNLDSLRAGVEVNLERPLAAGARFGGHLVQGHVDGTGELISLDPAGGGDWWLEVCVPREVERYCVEKGSIAIDGISLTIASVAEDLIRVAVIPHTYANTNLRTRRAGDRLNLECDILAKYVERLLGGRASGGGLTEERLREWGY